MSQKARKQADFGIEGSTYGATYSNERGGINDKPAHQYRTTA